MKFIAIIFIRFYQKFISPYKGFRCAHASLHSGNSCSEAIKLIIQKHGVFDGYPLAKSRLNECRAAYVQIVMNEQYKKRKKNSCVSTCSGCDEISDCSCDCSLGD